jgi:ankyrin repeat protein
VAKFLEYQEPKELAEQVVNYRNDYGNTPLFRAFRTSRPFEALELLIRCGADVNVRNTNGTKPIYHAIFMDDPKIFKLLVDAGTSLDAPCNSRDETPPQMADRLGKHAILEFLISRKPLASEVPVESDENDLSEDTCIIC